MEKMIVLIPAYKPEDKMLRLLESLREYQGTMNADAEHSEKKKDTTAAASTETGTAEAAESAAGRAGKREKEIDGIVIVDDGGQQEYRALFDAAEAMGCRVVHHEVNRGKGAAIRTGLQAAIDYFGKDVHVVTADADGQHLPRDIVRVARTLSEKNGKRGSRPVLVLGVRDFSGDDVPWRSRTGNRITAAFFTGFLFTCFSSTFSPLLYIVFVIVGVGWAMINVNSLPMVVEMCKGSDIGKFTGYYYTFSMAAQTVTPIVAGFLLSHVGYQTLFPYAAVFAFLSFVTMLFVKHGDSRKIARKGLETFDDLDL